MSETEQSILAAAKKIFIQKGFAAARMQEIADEAKINKALLHYYFRSKQKLFQVIVSDTFSLIIPRLAEAIDYKGSVLEKLEKIVETYIDTIKEHPFIPTFMLMELAHGRAEFIVEVKKSTDRFPNFQKLFMQIIQEGNEGIIKQSNPLHLLLNTISLCVFPFLVKPIFTKVVEVPGGHYEKLMDERKKEIKLFLRNALSP